jgi:hypothetical protein
MKEGIPGKSLNSSTYFDDLSNSMTGFGDMSNAMRGFVVFFGGVKLYISMYVQENQRFINRAIVDI